MYSIYDQINNRKVLVYPERTTDSFVITNEKIVSTYFPEDHDVNPEIYFDKLEIGEGNFIYHGDNLQVLKSLSNNSIDSCITDGPYGLKFMGKDWDEDVPSVELWKEVYRVLKPGGYLLSFGSPRTYHRMAQKVEDAGFEIRDQIMWVYGSGFPKSHDVGKYIDKVKGNVRQVIAVKKNPKKGMRFKYENDNSGWIANDEIIITKGESKYEGWGTNLKPAHEPIVMARKPFKGSLSNNVLMWNTGGVNIDDCRISNELIINKPAVNKSSWEEVKNDPTISEGRFPANIIFDEEAGKILDQQSVYTKTKSDKNCKNFKGIGKHTPTIDERGASRFFYCPKPSTKEREEGLTGEAIQIKGRDVGQDNTNVPHKLRKTGRKNTHTTVKPLKLMQYLIRLVTPKGGVTIDPYFGSGTSGKSTIREGNYKFIGIEKEKEYFDIAIERCQFEHEQSLKVAA
jgi:site-specific DNA-methyltransferase (adenine-specific)